MRLPAANVRVLICRSNPISPDPRVEKLASALGQAGYAVEVIGWDRTGALPAVEGKDHYRINRLAIKARYGRGLLNLPNLLRWQLGLLIWLLRHWKGFDVLHACDFDTVLPALLSRRLWGLRVVYDIFDFYADHLRATPGPIKRAIRSVDLRAVGQADAVILADQSRREQIAGSQPRRCEVIYNSPRDVREHFGIAVQPPAPGTLRLAYVGLLQVERGLIELLEVLKKHPTWRLELAGFGGDEGLILPHAQELPNVNWNGRVSYERALQLSAAADVLLATYDPAIPNHRYSSPNKVFEAMMLGIPIVVAQGTNMDRLIEAHQAGVVVPYGDRLALESALADLAAHPERRHSLGQNGRRAYEAHYSWSTMQARLLDLYREVLADGGER